MWTRLRAPWDCKSRPLMSAPAGTSMRPSQHLRATDPTRFSSAVAPFLSADVSNWSSWLRATRSLPRMGRVNMPKSAACTKEQKALEDRMVEHVHEARRERERRRPRHSVRLEGERKAKPDENDPDVFHGVVREQPLEVVLHQRVKHAHHGGDAAEREYHHAPPPGGRAGEIESDTHEAIDGDLGHHPAHQCRDMAWRRRMRERQPDVQRHQAGFGTGA